MGCSEVFEIDPITRCKHVDNGVCRLCYLKRVDGRFLTFGYIRYLNFENVERDLNKWSSGKVFIENYGDYLWERVPDVTCHTLVDILERVDEYKLLKGQKVHQWQLLTKRAARLEKFWRTRMEMTDSPIGSNKWLGVSVGNKPSTYYIMHVRRLAEISPDFIPFISFEPLLEDLMDFDGTYRALVEDNPDDPISQRYAGLYDASGMLDLTGIKWAIIGGESDATSPRPMNPVWAESIVSNCRKYRVKVFFKQLGGKGGDNAGGDLLNGRKIQEFPTI
jgi:protein gp37